MLTRTTFILGISILVLSSCNQFKKGEGDMIYKIHEDKGGPLITPADFIALTATEKTEEGTVTYDSRDYDRPSFMMMAGSLFKGDLYTGLQLLSEGDSATLKISIDSMVKMGKPKPINSKGKYFVYTVRINKVLSKGKLTDSLFREKVNEFMTREAEKWKKSEPSNIRQYISSNKIKPVVTSSGLNYQIVKLGNGPKPASGDTVAINYTNRLLSGKVLDTTSPEMAKKSGIFDAKTTYMPIKWVVGDRFSIHGVNEALLLLPQGTRAKLIIPSHLAYGSDGIQGIPPYTPLVFELEIIGVIPHK
jgi:FKBP-type peptidyl-prolyl cis-trans isomerase FkpA